MVILLTIFPVQEHSVSFHLFVSSFTSFIGVWQFSKYRYFTSLSKFIPRYFILFDAMVNGIVYLISLSDSSLLVYRNATDLCILILYPETLLNSLMSSSSFLVVSLDFTMYRIMLSTNKCPFYFFLFNLDAFYFFFFSDCCGWDFQN